MDSPLLTTHGAVAADAPDAGVAAHYGEPFREQRALVENAGLVDRGSRDVVRISGADRLTLLHSVTTQHLEKLRPHVATETLVLSPQGRVQHHLELVDDGEAVWAHTEPGEAPAVVEFLESMRFLLRLEPADASADYAVLTLAGPDAAGLVPGDVLARRTDHGTDLFVPRERVGELARSLGAGGAGLAGLWAYEALRVAGCRPRHGFETDHRTIPHEVGWIGAAVHLDKGCYRGQETVARVHNLGHPPRRLVFLHLDGSVDALPEHGAAVEREGRQVGTVTSAARHHELGPVALALVKRTTPVEDALLAGGVAAAQEVVVSPDAGANARVDPALRRS